MLWGVFSQATADDSGMVRDPVAQHERLPNELLELIYKLSQALEVEAKKN